VRGKGEEYLKKENKKAGQFVLRNQNGERVGVIQLNPKKSFLWKIVHCWQLYVMLLPAIIFFILFHYVPLAGVQIAFRDYKAMDGIWGSKWVGLKYFKRFVSSVQFKTLIWNTLNLSLTNLFAGFPLPILFAIILNEIRSQKVKKAVQNVTYAPHFISTVVVVGMLSMFLAPKTGIINFFIEALGGTATDFMGKAKAFVPIYVISDLWQNLGWNVIIYAAALTNVDVQLYDAAKIDGANRLQKIWHVDIPSILPTAVLLLILKCGNVLSVGYEKTYLMQNSLNLSTSEIISTYVYKVGLIKAQYSYTAAIGLFNSVVNVTLLVIVNRIAKKIGDISLF